jgi:hypothetical protein
VERPFEGASPIFLPDGFTVWQRQAPNHFDAITYHNLLYMFRRGIFPQPNLMSENQI